MTRGAERKRSFGIVGGVSPAADADLLRKLAAAAASPPDGARFDFACDTRLSGLARDGSVTDAERLMSIYDAIDALEARGVAAVVLPLFLEAPFAEELRSNTPLPVIEPVDALLSHVESAHPRVRRIGLLVADERHGRSLFATRFPPERYELFEAGDADVVARVCAAVRAEGGLAAGHRHGRALDRLRGLCSELAERGAELILPGAMELALVAAELAPAGVPVLDPNRAYASHVVAGRFAPVRRHFKLGVVGGVGPAATLDFLQKVMRNTPARRDQDHLRLVVEQNPQIPDRTEHLVGDGVDPTLALYATCKKLQAGRADLIAIPCNTAHAFVEEIQSHLHIPIMNMLTVTVAHVRQAFPALRQVGLLATTGTVASGVYRRALAAQGLAEIVPRPPAQERVMNAIYGPRGVKAGHTSGEAIADAMAAIEDLAAQGAEVMILGCTELPLLFPDPGVPVGGGRRVTLVDPTEILAVRCVSEAMSWSAP